MVSKYDGFWIARKTALHELLKEASLAGVSRSIVLSDIRAFGDRQSWAGSVELFDLKYEGGKGAVHMKALGRLLSSLTVDFPGVRFHISMDKSCQLRVRTTSASAVPEKAGDLALIKVDSPLPLRSKRVSQGRSEAIHHLVWRLRRYRAPGSFSSLPVNGIYFYFEEGEETSHGSRIVRVGINEVDGRFRDRVAGHFHGNRHGSVFRKHLGSALLRKRGAPKVLIEQWEGKERIPREEVALAEVEREVACLLHDRFAFAVVPVPDAARRKALEIWVIKVLTSDPFAAPSEVWLGRWAASPKIRGSGLWNVEYVGGEASVEQPDLMKYLEKASSIDESQDTAGRPAAIARGATLLILPCSKKKILPASRVFQGPTGRSLLDFVPDTAGQIQKGREGLKNYINWTSKQYAALDYYAGWVYRASGFRQAVSDAVRAGRAEAIILSGAYGAVFADELIHNYNKKLDARYWRRHALDRALEEFISRSGTDRAYAFAAVTSPYAQVLKSVNWRRPCRQSLLKEAGLFTVDFQGDGGAQRAVPSALGAAVAEFIQAGFAKESILGGTWSGQRLRYESFC